MSRPSVALMWREWLEGFRDYCRAAGHSAATVRLRLSYLGRLSELGVAPDELDAEALISWLAGHEWAPETRKSCRAALRAFFGWAVRTGRLGGDPTAGLPSIRVPAGMPRPAPSSALAAALAGASSRDRLMLMLAAYAGLRRAEIARLPWSAVSWSGLRITGKGGRTRVVPTAPELAAELEAEAERRNAGRVCDGWRYRVDPRSPYVFPGVGGGHIHPETVGHVITAALGSGWTAHTLRHRFATRAYSAERDLLAVQQLLGHSKPETTARYTAVPSGAAAAAVAAATAA